MELDSPTTHWVLLTRRSRPIKAARFVAALVGRNKATVGLHAIKTDDVPADDVKTVSGRLMIPSGTKVTLALITAPGDLANIAKLVDKTPVRQ